MYHIVTHPSAPLMPLPDYSEAGFFFNEERQLRQQDQEGFHLFTVNNTQTQRSDARCAIFIDTRLAISPKAAPFGSIEFVNALPDSALSALIDSLEVEVVSRLKLPTLRLINYPYAYAPQQAGRLTTLLKQHGYRVVDQMLNFHIDVSSTPFRDGLHPSERRRLAKCHRSNFQVRRWVRPSIDTVVDFIRNSRQQQGYPLTIAPDRLAHLLGTFPDEYPVFAVWDGDVIASLTVAVRVRHDILYNFLPADNLTYRPHSPAVMLTQGLYEYCQQEAITLLDLGVAVDDQRRPKPNLMRFKRNLGAQESWKLVLEKHFSLSPLSAESSQLLAVM